MKDLAEKWSIDHWAREDLVSRFRVGVGMYALYTRQYDTPFH